MKKILFLTAILAMLLMAACTRTIYLPAQTTHTTRDSEASVFSDTMRHSSLYAIAGIRLSRDSVHTADSTIIDRRADTIMIMRTKTVTRDRLRTDTVTMIRTDTVTVFRTDSILKISADSLSTEQPYPVATQEGKKKKSGPILLIAALILIPIIIFTAKKLQFK